MSTPIPAPESNGNHLYPDKPSLMDKLVWGSINAAERLLFHDNFVVANLTPYEEIHRNGLLSIRHYDPLEAEEITVGDRVIPVTPGAARLPLVLVPPLAATSMIFDLLPQRSIVRYFLARGFDVYLIDWGDVTQDHSHLSLGDYVHDWMPEAMSVVQRHAERESLSCFCYCLGGLFTLLYAASYPAHPIRNIVTVASPIDIHQSGLAGRALALIYRPARLISNLLNLSLMDLPARYTHIPGWVNALVFKLTNPLGSVISTLELLVNFWDREYVTVHTTMSRWFDDMADYPGQAIKEIVLNIGLRNQMAEGRMQIGDREALFHNIDCAVLAIAGASDKLVSPASARHVLDIVSSPDRSFEVLPGGHAGVLAGRRAPEETWTRSADWLLARSG